MNIGTDRTTSSKSQARTSNTRSIVSLLDEPSLTTIGEKRLLQTDLSDSPGSLMKKSPQIRSAYSPGLDSMCESPGANATALKTSKASMRSFPSERPPQVRYGPRGQRKSVPFPLPPSPIHTHLPSQPKSIVTHSSAKIAGHTHRTGHDTQTFIPSKDKSNVQTNVNPAKHPFYPLFNDGSLVFTPAYSEIASPYLVIRALKDACLQYAIGVNVCPPYFDRGHSLIVYRMTVSGSDKVELKQKAKEFIDAIQKIRAQNKKRNLSQKLVILCGDRSICPMLIAYFLIINHKRTVDGALYTILSTWRDARPISVCLEILNELENKLYGGPASGYGLKKGNVYTFNIHGRLPKKPEEVQRLFNPSWISWVQSTLNDGSKSQCHIPTYTERHLLGNSSIVTSEYILANNIVAIIVLGNYQAFSRTRERACKERRFREKDCKHVYIEYDSQDLHKAIKSVHNYLKELRFKIEKAKGYVLICDAELGGGTYTNLAACVYAGVLMRACRDFDNAYYLGLRPALIEAFKKIVVSFSNQNVCMAASSSIQIPSTSALSTSTGFIAQLRCFERIIRPERLGTSPFGNSAHRLLTIRKEINRKENKDRDRTSGQALARGP